MSFLIDTNVLLRFSQSTHAMHADAAGAIRKLLYENHQLFIIPQNLIEFWAVATRPASANGLGYSPDQTAQELIGMKSIFTLQPDTPAIYLQWEEVVKNYAVSGRQAHDARIVAAMLTHDIDNLLTFNIQDFKRYRAITVTSPAEVVNS